MHEMLAAAIDPTFLTAVVRQAQGKPDFTVLDWQVETLSHRGAVNPAGILQVKGQGRVGDILQPWAVALKIVKQPAWAVDPSHLGYWQREANAYQSGLLTSLPGPVRPARCYGVDAQAASRWIWLELLTDSASEQWTLVDYRFAAEALGRFNGACAQHFPLPDAPWLARGHARVWNGMMNFEQAWQNPLVRQRFSAANQSRLLALWAERERFYTVLDQLPQLFSHFDYKRANLFICQRADQQREVVAVDWGDCGIGALGGDLVFLVAASAAYFDWGPDRVVELSTVAYAAYLQGLYATGWRGNEAQIRLAYTAWTAMHFGPPAAAIMDFVLTEENRAATLRLTGHPPEDFAHPYQAFCDFTLACADEARQLMDQLGL